MSNYFKIKYAFAFWIGLTLISCGKDSEVFEPYRDIGQIDNLINKINDNTESYSFNANVESQIVTSTNMVVTIPVGSLLNSNGEIFDGQAKLYVIDVVSSGQSILTGYSTKVEGSVFYTSTLMNIDIRSLEGDQMKINTNNKISIKHPRDKDKVDDQSKMYFGTTKSSAFIWSELMNPGGNYDLSIGDWEVVGESGSIFGFGYKYSIDQFGWIGIGNYFDNSTIENDKFCVNLPELFNKDNTKVFFVFKEQVSVVNLQPLEDSNSTFCGLIAKPMTSEGWYFISLSTTENGDAYLGYLENPNLESNIFEVFPQKTSIDKISQFLYGR